MRGVSYRAGGGFVVLAIGDPSDRLLCEVRRQRPEVILCEERTLFESSSFALRIGGRCSEGFLNVSGQYSEFAEVSGVLLRPPRLWWPAPEFDLSDQMFVYHETVASWFAVFSSLGCPIVNRFGLGWWLQDLTYPLELRDGLSRTLGLPVGGDEIPPGRCLRPTAREDSNPLGSVYIAGGAAIPVPGWTCGLEGRFASSREALTVWQVATGIGLCRADFTRDDTVRLIHVDPFPLLETETEEAVTKIAIAILQPMAATREGAA